METKTIKLYTFEELTTTQKAEVLDNYRQWNVDGIDWWKFEYENFIERMSKQGFKIKDIYFRGFWSQGDGASFVGEVDLSEYIKFHKLSNKYRLLLNFINEYGGKAVITQSGMYVHEYTMRLEIDLDTWDFECYLKDTNKINRLVEQTNKLEKRLQEQIIEEAKQLYKDLEEGYDYLTSDESLEEYFLNNDYLFTEEGEMGK